MKLSIQPIKVFFLFTLFTSFGLASGEASRTVAVTIDDLPVVSTRTDIKNRRTITRKLLSHIRAAGVPAVGFVNEGKLYINGQVEKQQVDLLRLWLRADLELGNHTYSHLSLNRIPIKEYKEDLLKGEVITKDLLGRKGMLLRYFRHPYLQTGRDLETKAEFAEFLRDRGYTIAPVTIDNADYIFSRAYDRAFDAGDNVLQKRIGDAYVPYMEKKFDYWERQSEKLFGREISQTLLLHANYINSDYFDDLATMLKRRGYRFVSLEEALRDEAYRSPDKFLGAAGISWLHRWALEKGRDNILDDEPKVPEFVLKASGFESE